jgi:hypothetical protein
MSTCAEVSMYFWMKCEQVQPRMTDDELDVGTSVMTRECSDASLRQVYSLVQRLFLCTERS